MKILIVAHTRNGKFSSFVQEQASALSKTGCSVDYFGIEGHGLFGYLKHLSPLKKKITEIHPDLIHAHYGLSGLLANLQRRIPVVTTYHGSDVHAGGFILFLSRLCMRLSRFNIFVSRYLLERSGYSRKNAIVLPCGIDISIFFPMKKADARLKLEESGCLKFGRNKKYVLFAGSFDNPVKNFSLASEVVGFVNRRLEALSVELLELKGFNRHQVCLLLNSVDCLLMTSFREGSPMIIKEALAVGCPIVSSDVGDVKERIAGVEDCFVAEGASDLADGVYEAIMNERKPDMSSSIQDITLEVIAEKLLKIYNIC